ncbi:MAG: hypothetical protein UY15_C0032G0010 [Parcubacteria group bacterium GW2011_GWA2_47_9]|nr:MAG: hypothetical protein UY15_C0032G0010 [Parcubacteria group bacterium GW2011_GWA2_47_9]
MFKIPTKPNFATCHKTEIFLPMKNATESPASDKIGRTTGKAQTRGRSTLRFLKTARISHAQTSPITKAASMSLFFMPPDETSPDVFSIV